MVDIYFSFMYNEFNIGVPQRLRTDPSNLLWIMPAKGKRKILHRQALS